MTFTLEDKRDKIRSQLQYEITHPKIWYDKSKQNNIDIFEKHPECPYSDTNGWISLYRYVWWLNYPEDIIEYDEVIHHKNGDHTDNRIENLEKMKAKLHRKLHGASISKSKNSNKPSLGLCKNGVFPKNRSDDFYYLLFFVERSA